MKEIISYPKDFSEFEIQSEIFWKLKQNNIDIRGEVKSICLDFSKKHKVRFDLVVFKNQNAVCIIECKNWKNINLKYISGRQKRRYEKFNLPIFVCGRKIEIDTTVNKILDFYRHIGG